MIEGTTPEKPPRTALPPPAPPAAPRQLLGSGATRQEPASKAGKEPTPPTCPKGFGHQPGEITGDFGSGEIIMVEGLDGGDDESLPHLLGVRGIPHLPAGPLAAPNLHG